MALHQRIMDVVRDTGGARFDSGRILERIGERRSPTGDGAAAAAAAAALGMTLSVSRCTHRLLDHAVAVDTDKRHRAVLEIRCDVEW